MQRFHDEAFRKRAERIRYKPSPKCALCRGTGVAPKKLSDGTSVDADCPCTENGRPISRGPKDTSAQRAKIMKARRKKQEAAKRKAKARR